MNVWQRIGWAVTWLTLGVCAAAPTLAATLALAWFVTSQDDTLVADLSAHIHVPVALVLLIALALAPWWAFACALITGDKRRLTAPRAT